MKKPIFILFLLMLFSFVLKVNSQELSPQKVFESYNKSVVIINCYDPNGIKKGQGSGVILEDRGIVITNFHLFVGSEKFDIMHNDTTIGYTEIVGVNIEKDIMVFKVYANEFPKIPVGNSANLIVGDKVYAIGSPIGMENTISEGIVSGFRTIGKNKRNMIQITASLSPGSSGGAVFNSAGELVGISTMKLKDGENLNFMIPINEVMTVIDSGLYEKQTIKALKFLYNGIDALEAGNNYDAIDNMTKYIQMVPPESKAYNMRGRAYLAAKNFEKALSDFQQAIKIDNKNKAAYSNRGECYYLMEEYDKAVEDFNKVIKMDKEYYYAYLIRGLCYAKDDNHNKAIADYSFVIDKDPNNITGLINRGISYLHIDLYDKAIADWKRVIAIDPSYATEMQKLINVANFIKWNY